jgi:hypothetical protein
MDRYRYKIRDLLWLAMLVGLCAAWTVDHRALKSVQSQLKELLQQKTLDYKRARARVRQLESAMDSAGIPVPRGPTVEDVLDALGDLPQDQP